MTCAAIQWLPASAGIGRALAERLDVQFIGKLVELRDHLRENRHAIFGTIGTARLTLLARQADAIERAIAGALAKGYRTADINSDGGKAVSTREMGDAILSELEKLAA